MRADAATLKTFKDGSTVKLQHDGTYLYKYTIAEDSLVEISWAGVVKPYGIDIYVYADKACSKRITWNYTSDASGKMFLALKKGTYYLNLYEGVASSTRTTTGKVKIKSTPATAINKDNYTLGKAAALEAKKWAKVVQTPLYNYARWYKIKITKAQKVTIDTPLKNATFFDVYSSSLMRCPVEYSGTTVTTDKLAKGTYFLRVSAMTPTNFTQGRGGLYLQFKWH